FPVSGEPFQFSPDTTVAMHVGVTNFFRGAGGRVCKRICRFAKLGHRLGRRAPERHEAKRLVGAAKGVDTHQELTHWRRIDHEERPIAGLEDADGGIVPGLETGASTSKRTPGWKGPGSVGPAHRLERHDRSFPAIHAIDDPDGYGVGVRDRLARLLGHDADGESGRLELASCKVRAEKILLPAGPSRRGQRDEGRESGPPQAPSAPSGHRASYISSISQRPRPSRRNWMK